MTQVQIQAVRKAKGSQETVLGKVRFPKLEHCFITKKVADECGIPLDDESSTRLVEQGWAYRKAEEEATREAVELARSNPEQAALWQQEARQVRKRAGDEQPDT